MQKTGSIAQGDEQWAINHGTLMPSVDIYFSAYWWHNRHGFDFDESYWLDPVRRTEEDREMRRLLYDEFGELGMGEQDPKPAPHMELHGHRFMSALFGCPILYTKDQAPIAEALPCTVEAMESLHVPVLEETMAYQDAITQARILERRYGFCSGGINTGSPLNTAVSLFGGDFLEACVDEEDSANHVLDAIAKTTVEVYDQITCRYSSQNHNPAQRFMGLGNCPVVMISPRMYESLVLPHDFWLRRQAAQFGLHHCGAHMERYLAAYKQLNPLVSVQVGWGSDFEAVCEAFPGAQIEVLLNPNEVAGRNTTEVDQICTHIIQTCGERLAAIWVADAGPEISDDLVSALRTYPKRVRMA